MQCVNVLSASGRKFCNLVSKESLKRLIGSPNLQNRRCYKFTVVKMNQTPARTDKIVIVDDDARIRDLLRRYLTQEGFEVIVAEDGKALNRILLRDTVDLIVLDLMMPGEDGLSVCRR